MERSFNTAGPNRADIDYTLPPLSRFDLEDILNLIDKGRYFVLHAPRQTGKTSCMLALRDYLNKEGRYIAVYANVEGGQASRDDKATVVRSTVDTITGELQLIQETGQIFDEACFPLVWDATEGQPWLVNALGNEVTWKMRENRDRSVRIIPEMIDRTQGLSWDERIWHSPYEYAGHRIMVWGM